MGIEDIIVRALRGAPFRWIVREPDAGTSDPVRMFRGAPATIVDLQNGWGVERRVRVGDSILTSLAFSERLAAASAGSVFVLRAPTGEGKTTFVRQLANHLKDQCAVLWWTDPGVQRVDLLSDLRRELGAMNVGIIVAVELTHEASIESARRMAAELTLAPLPCPLLVTGSPADVSRCHVIGGIPLSLCPMEEEEFELLVQQLQRIVLMGEWNGEALTNALPNVHRFLQQPDFRLFQSDTLLVSLLKATYGLDFRARLVDEFRRLSASDRMLYRLICVTNAVKVPLSMNLARSLVCDIDSARDRPKGSPWECEEGRLFARSAVIAKTVIQELGMLGTPIAECIDRMFVAHGVPEVERAKDIRSLLRGYATFEPVHAVDDAEEKELRGAMRRLVFTHREWLEGVRGRAARECDWAGALSWGALMYKLQVGARGDDRRVLAEENGRWLEVAVGDVPAGLEAELEYWRAKAGWLAGGGLVGGDSQEAVLDRWRRIYGSQGLGIDYYVDVASQASTQARAKRKGLEEDEARELSVLAARAFERALVQSDGVSRGRLEAMYSGLISEVSRWGGAQLVALLEAAWAESLELGEVNVRTGTRLAHELRQVGQSERAKQVLFKLLAHCCWGDALFELCDMARQDGDDAIRSFIQRYVGEYPLKQISRWQTPLSQALAASGFAMILRLERGRVTEEESALRAACFYYGVAHTSDWRATWNLHGDIRWRSCIARLHELAGTKATTRERTEFRVADEAAKQRGTGKAELRGERSTRRNRA